MDLGPSIRIGILQNQEIITVNTKDKVSLKGDSTLEIPSSTSLVFKIKEGIPAKGFYKLRLSNHISREEAEKSLSNLPDNFPKGSVLKVGRLVVHHEKEIYDNTSYWASIGSYSSKSEAESERVKLGFDNPPDIIFHRTEKPSGIIEVFQDGKLILSSSTPIKIEQSDLHKSDLEIKDVIIGVGFHWEHKLNHQFRGALEIIPDNKGLLTAVNITTLEEYLYSVCSSEMSASDPEELLKAQTICARATYFATVGKHHQMDDFDICNYDHCQCYYGAGFEEQPSIDAANLTSGEILRHGDVICDTRYSKICGGIMEQADEVWWEGYIPYMVEGIDSPESEKNKIKEICCPPDGTVPRNMSEATAKKWIDSKPDVFCNTDEGDIPPHFLPSGNLFRWKVKYTRDELTALITKNTGEKFGELVDLEPLRRGASGRISLLKIIGTEKTFNTGKELAIRYALHESCLYSSAFYILKEMDDKGEPVSFTLKGAGWGHGVGLCQIGAAKMAGAGYNYEQILVHYFKGSRLEKMY